MADRPFLLAITSELPWPLDTGGHLRSFHLLTGLARRFDVRLVAGAGAHTAAAVEALGSRGVTVTGVALGPRHPLGEASRVLRATVRGEPYVLYRRHDRPEMRESLAALGVARRPDLVYLDHLDSAIFADLFPGVPIVADMHNIYSLVARRAADEHPSSFRAAVLRREARLLARMERRLAERAGALFAVSDEECAYYRTLGARRVHLVPNGVDCAAYAHLADRRFRRPDPLMLYIGTMSWLPNAAAARFLADDVLPRVRARFPGARLRIVGKNPPAALVARHGRAGIEITGTVPDVVPHLLEADLLAVPLETGGGTRLKILEAFAAGLPIVSTPVGAEGIACTPGRHLAIAPRERFADAVVDTLTDHAAARARASEARALARRVYDWRAIVAGATAAIDELIGDPPHPASARASA